MNGWTSVLVPHRARPPGLPGGAVELDVRGLDDPAALLRLDALDKKIADRSLQRKLDPDAPLFIDFEEHVRTYEGTDRRPVFIRHDRDRLPPALHLPDEPMVRAERWLDAIAEGADLMHVTGGSTASAELLVVAAGGVAGLGGVTEGTLEQSCSDTAARSGSGWPANGPGPQSCSGLMGRITRRMAAADAPGSDRAIVGVPGSVIALEASPSAARRGGARRRRLGGASPASAGSILGPNGLRKTTMLQLAGARLWPTLGAVEILGPRWDGSMCAPCGPVCAGQRLGDPHSAT